MSGFSESHRKPSKKARGRGRTWGDRSGGPGRGTKAQLCPSAPNWPEDQPPFLCMSLVSYSLLKSYPHFSPVLLTLRFKDRHKQKTSAPSSELGSKFLLQLDSSSEMNVFTKRKLPHSQRRPDREETHPKDV